MYITRFTVGNNLQVFPLFLNSSKEKGDCIAKRIKWEHVVNVKQTVIHVFLNALTYTRSLKHSVYS